MLGARHRLHHIAGEGGVEIAEGGDAAALAVEMDEELRLLRLGHALRLDRAARLVDRLEVARVARVTLSPVSASLPSAPTLVRRMRKAAAWPNWSSSTASGARHSAKRTPSSIAFSTSSWLRV